MKIVFFSNSYLPYQSGITVTLKTLRKELQKLGHTVYLVAPQYPHYKETDPDVFRLLSFPATYPGYRFVFPYSFSVFSKLRNAKIDLIHAHQPFGVGLAARVFAKSLNVPFVYSLHTLFPRYVHHVPFLPRRLSKTAVSLYLKFFCNWADAVTVPSEMVRRWLLLMKLSSPVAVVPSGVEIKTLDIGHWTLDIRKKHGLSPAAKILLYTGRLSEEKNIRFLLDVFPAIGAAEKQVVFLLVGGGPKEKEYRRLAASIDPRIIFTGEVIHSALEDYYLAADLFVYSSTTETQGLVLCEAKAYGLPVVAVFGGGISDVVRSGIDGYLAPQNKNKFAEHVIRLLQDEPLRRKMSEKAKEDCRIRFSAAAVAKKMETLYNSLIEKRGVAHV